MDCNLLLFIALYALSTYSYADTLQKCSLGRYFDDGKCRLCPPGTYQNRTMATACQPCPTGTYNSYRGAQGIDVCRRCPPGTFLNSTGATSMRACRKCPSGTASPPGSYACISCPKKQQMALCPLDYTCSPGTCALLYVFNDVEAFAEPRLTCRPCFRGYRLAEDGYTCEECNSPFVVDQASQTCVKCPPGTGHDYLTSRCLPCMRFEFHDGLTGRCRKCRKGMIGISEKGAKSCVLCPRGTFSRRGRCEPCKKGENSFARGATYCRPDNLPCASNFFRAFSGVCKRCNRRERYDVKRRRCVPCAKNQVSMGGLATKCLDCRRGEVATSTGCLCREGWEFRDKKCRQCLPGTAKDTTYNYEECLPCSRGTYAPRAGMKQCLFCPEGFVQPESGKTKCIRLKCGKGLYPSSRLRDVLPQLGCNRYETNCPPNSTRIMAFNTDILIHCNPHSCPEGSLKEESNVDDFRLRQCVKCQTYEPVLDATKKKCIGCPSGEINTGGSNALICKDCGPGFHAGATRCLCNSGMRIVKGKCLACPRGTYGTPEGACLPCPPGTFSNRRGFSSCQNCGKGKFSGRGSRKCEKCPEGTTTFGEGEANCVGPVL